MAMKSYNHRKRKPEKSELKGIVAVQGETIEAKVRRLLNNKEPIEDSADTVYTERKEGVKPETNIRTDKMEMLVELTDKKTAAHLAARQERHSPTEPKTENSSPNEGEGRTQATNT